MTKNKDINITPSKGISIIIKNDIQQLPPPIKPKKKRKYKRINVLPKTPAPPIMQQSAGDTRLLQVILKHSQGDFLYGVILQQLHQY